MIGADTNILLRLMVPEVTAESKRVATFISRIGDEAPIFVGVIVIVEMVWVLERKYGYSRQQSVMSVRYLLDSPDFLVENAELLAAAIERVGKSGSDIADELIATINADRGCSRTVTSDRRAARDVPGMELLK